MAQALKPMFIDSMATVVTIESGEEGVAEKKLVKVVNGIIKELRDAGKSMWEVRGADDDPDDEVYD